MARDKLSRNRRTIVMAYICMLLSIFTLFFALFAYLFARKITIDLTSEVWLQAHAFWIMRNSILYAIVMLFASIWFIPLYFYYWDTYIWVTVCTVIGVIFAAIGSLFLLNAWLKGISRFFKNKAVF